MRHSTLNGVRYDRYMGGRGLLDAGIPWLSVGAIVALETYILNVDVLRRETLEGHAARFPRRVLEFGSGGSTIFWARRVDHVTSFETDPKWAPMTAATLRKYELEGKVTLRAVPHAEALLEVAALPDESFDLLLVDHADPTLRRGRIVDRLPLAAAGVSKLTKTKTAWLVVDNFAMHGMQHFDYAKYGFADVWKFEDMRYSGRGTLIARRNSA